MPVIWLCSTYNCWPDPGVVLASWGLVAISFGAFYVVEPVSYYASIGMTGTYLSFLSGNIGKMSVPCAALAGKDMVITEIKAPNMGGEDFACYLQEVPGAFFFLSSADASKGTDVPHHNPKFNVDEDVLYKGPSIFVSIVEKMLGK